MTSNIPHQIINVLTTLTEPLQMKHLDFTPSSSTPTACCWRFLALTLPNATGMCRGGCRLGSKSILYSCFNHRAVRGNLFHGAARSMLETTRQWNCRLDSFFERRDTWESRREEWGCCHAHSNCRSRMVNVSFYRTSQTKSGSLMFFIQEIGHIKTALEALLFIDSNKSTQQVIYVM